MFTSRLCLLFFTLCMGCGGDPQRPAQDPADPHAPEGPTTSGPRAFASASAFPTGSAPSATAPAPMTNPHAGHSMGGSK